MTHKHLWIGGQAVEAKAYRPLHSPYSGEQLVLIPDGDADEMDRAIAAAEQAAPEMARMPAHRRAAILERLAARLSERAEEAAVLLAREAAKPIAVARLEVARTIETYKFSAEEAKRIHGETLALDAAPGGEGRFGYTIYEPLGVIGAITPFNFPLNLVAHKVGPAIATGNAVVLKPATQTPLSAYLIAELLHEAGLPAGALNIVTGRGGAVGEQLVTDPRVKKVTFTGSPEVGAAIRAKAGLKRVTLELGSNSALIIDRNAAVDRIVDRCITGAFSFQGQVCISLQRIYVHEAVYEPFVRLFVERTQRLRLGDPLEESTDISALITERDAIRTVEWIREAEASGATIACGGGRTGSLVQPTVLLDVDASMKVSCQEVFAPIVHINRVKNIDEAIAAVNDSRFGLQAGIYTNDIETAMDAASRLHVGGVMINDIPTFRVDQMPYGGVKESGIGREGIRFAMQDMMELKLVVINRQR
ncbi:aldehyde dehydrogenase family protein [Paenibacillus koleovorans]|uniref:aldehyde dehydrogenase family protein n=1 Tax=Paenibacillus koleovorans TaxID=121608 RepID=UPI000FDAEFEC|nr:aldehyde dehydrogenase family protein [Paenibacillus koleovorans]